MFNVMEKSMFKLALKKLGKWLIENKNGKINFNVDDKGIKIVNKFLTEYNFEVSKAENGYNFSYIGD